MSLEESRGQKSSSESGRSLWVAVRTLAVALAAVCALTVVPTGQSHRESGAFYIALGDSISVGLGASGPDETWVRQYFGFLESNGSGVTDLLNTAESGQGIGDVINRQLPLALAKINSSTPVRAVTIDIGINDIPFATPCSDSTAACAWATDFRSVLSALNGALRTRDPGVRVQVMEYHDLAFGASRRDEARTALLGVDMKVDCAGRGPAIGLNDLIACVALDEGAVPVDLIPIFDAGGAGFIITDGHPSNAGHHAIALAFGGAATPTRAAPTQTPTPTPPSCVVPRVVGKQLAVAKRALTAAHCGVGSVSTRRSKTAAKGIVILQSSPRGTHLSAGGHVNLTVSRGQ
jgi:hypothetical protein